MDQKSREKISHVIVIVGAGGIGSNLFQKIARYAPGKYDILLIDGDVVEGKNILRQCFTKSDIGRNKAEVLTEKANNTLCYRHSSYAAYLSTEGIEGAKTLEKLTKEYTSTVLFGAVDNNPARVQMEIFFDRSDKNLLYIDAANEEMTGDVVCCWKFNGEQRGSKRSEYDYSVMLDKENDPNKKSCSEKLDEGNVQTLIANDKAAIIALEFFQHHLYGETVTGLGVFDECVKQASS